MREIVVELFLLELTPLMTFFLKHMLIKFAETNQHLLWFCVILFQLVSSKFNFVSSKFFIKNVAGWTEESSLLKQGDLIERNWQRNYKYSGSARAEFMDIKNKKKKILNCVCYPVTWLWKHQSILSPLNVFCEQIRQTWLFYLFFLSDGRQLLLPFIFFVIFLLGCCLFGVQSVVQL